MALLADSCLQCGGVGLALASPLDYSVVEVDSAGSLGVYLSWLERVADNDEVHGSNPCTPIGGV